MRENKKTTEELMETILQSVQTNKNIQQLIEELEAEQLHMTLKDYLDELLAEKNLTISKVIKKSGLNKNYVYNIFDGNRKNIAREKLLALAFGMEMTLEETQKMLKIARKSILYPRIQFDLVVIFALKKKWTLIDTNELLEDLQEPLLA